MENIIKPISPNDIMDNLEKIIPSVVIQAVNELLKTSYRGQAIVLKQEDIVNEIIKLDGSLTRTIIFEKKYLDFEKIYENNGWVVEYDKPGFNEDYTPIFKFTKKK